MSTIAGTIRSSLGVVRIRGAKLHFNVLSYGTLVKQQATTFQIVPQIRDYLKKAKWQLGSKFPLSYSKIILKASIVSQILIITSGYNSDIKVLVLRYN